MRAGSGGKRHLNRDQGGSRTLFKEETLKQLRHFVNPANPRPLRIINPAQFEVTRQLGWMSKEGTAELAALTPCEITAIISEATLAVSQEIEMSDQARLCLVCEEAHSLVPEWNSVASDCSMSLLRFPAAA
jgi:uncharacterized protein